MRVIITGGTGLIGRALAASLVEANHEVIALSRSPRSGAVSPGIRLVGWDGRSSQGWGHLADGAHAIVNLAGESVAGESFLPQRWTTARKQRILQSRVDAGQAVVTAVQEATRKPVVVVQASAVGYYGPRADAAVTEDFPPGDDFLAGVCRAWEASTAPLEALGIWRAVVRIGVVLSAQGGALARQRLLFRWFAGGPLGSGRQGYPWIHIVDVVGAIRFLIETPQAQGEFNLTAPTPLTNADFGRALAKALKRPYWLPAPALAFKLAFGEVSTILLDGQMAYPGRLLAAGYTFRYPQIEEALKAL